MLRRCIDGSTLCVGLGERESDGGCVLESVLPKDVMLGIPAEKWVRHVGGLKAMADPLRIAIIRVLYRVDEELGCVPPRTARDVCTLLGETRTTRIYHHLKVLLEADLICKVARVQRGNLLEDYFGPVALSIRLDPDLLRGVRLGDDVGWLRATFSMLETVRGDLEALDPETPALRVVCMHRAMKVPKGSIGEFHEEFRALLDRYSVGEEGCEDGEDGVNLLMVTYPAAGE